MNPGFLLGKAGLVTLIGFLAVMLCLELMVLASIAIFAFVKLAPFLLVGLALWLPWRGLERAEIDWPRKARTLAGRCGRLARRIGGIMLETLSGALVGAMLGTLIHWKHQDAEFALPIGILIGGLIGLLVGTRNHLSWTADHGP